MSDLNLFSMGCLVTFVALAGAYIYLREAYARHQDDNEEAMPVVVQEQSTEREVA